MLGAFLGGAGLLLGSEGYEEERAFTGALVVLGFAASPGLAAI